MRRILLIACATAFAAAFAVSPLHATNAKGDDVPPVPTAIRVPAGNKLFRVGHATGTQNYTCSLSGGSVKYVLFTPQATLFENQKQVMTHYFGPNPDEGGTIRAAWQHSDDASTVWGEVKPGNSSADPAFVAPGAIPWLLVTIDGYQDGPRGGDKLEPTTFIQRLNTSGGVAPATGCSTTGDIGKQAFVPYTADYYFYKATR
jgi:hypothetical protein